MMDDHRHSDILEKSRNASTADAMGGGAVAERNSRARLILLRYSRVGTPYALERPQAERRIRKQRFTGLLHHVYDRLQLRLPVPH
jgi:hypothetical protein